MQVSTLQSTLISDRTLARQLRGPNLRAWYHESVQCSDRRLLQGHKYCLTYILPYLANSTPTRLAVSLSVTSLSVGLAIWACIVLVPKEGGGFSTYVLLSLTLAGLGGSADGAILYGCTRQQLHLARAQ